MIGYKKGKLELVVRIVAPDFEVIAESEKRLELPSTRDSAILSFPLRAFRAGLLRITVELFDLSETQVGTLFITTAISIEYTKAKPQSSLTLSVKVVDAHIHSSGNLDATGVIFTEDRPTSIAANQTAKQDSNCDESNNKVVGRPIRFPFFQSVVASIDPYRVGRSRTSNEESHAGIGCHQ